MPPISSVAPEATVVVDRVLPDSPSEPFASMRKVPAETEVAPVYVWLLVKRSEPVPLFVNPPVPDMTP